MNTYQKISERGQAIVYLVLGLVVFFGFVALAIDGGMVLADRRHAQNAADASSLAGAGKAATYLNGQSCPQSFSCNNAAEWDAVQSAIGRAGTNSFVIDNNITDNNGAVAECIKTETKVYLNVTVEISSTTPSNFLQLVYPDSLRNQVEAIAQVRPEQPIGLDDAVIGLNPGVCNGHDGVTVGGDAETIVKGGDIFSNGCISGDGSAGSATVITGTAEGHYLSPGNIDWNPEPTITGSTIEERDYYIDPPKLDESGNCDESLGHVYNVNHLDETLDPGLYCVKGNLNIEKDITGKDVTIYMLNGNLVYNGNATVNISAPDDDSTSDYLPAIKGLLIYGSPGHSITLNGTSSDTFTGLIYAPGSDINLSGNADTIFNGQVIGWNVKITGTNNMGVNYDACKGYLKKPAIDLYK